MRRAVALFALALVAPSGGAMAGNLTDMPGASGSSGAFGGASAPSTILSGAPVFSTDLPASSLQQAQRPAALGTSLGSDSPAVSEEVPNGTVRMLLTPPPRSPDDD
jgi:hypothetical protein